MFMKRNRNVSWRVVYRHIVEGTRKDLQDHTGHEFERDNKLHQVSNAPMNLNLNNAPFLPKLCQYFGAGGGNCNVQITNALEGRGWGMLKFRVNCHNCKQ